MTRFNVRDFGASGSGYSNDAPAIQAAVMAALAANGAVYLPPGLYLCEAVISFPTTAARISLEGDGSNVSTMLFRGCDGLDFAFAQNGAQQPFGCTIRNLGLRALGDCDRALRISYGDPVQTSDHNQASCTISNVLIASDPEGSWGDGIELEGAWNPTLENVFISGDSHGGDWSQLAGAGVSLIGYCVNAHLTNVRCNFFGIGLMAWAQDGKNTEGIFCANCSMVAVKCGVDIRGQAGGTGRISTLTWVGGLIEVRDVPSLAQQQAIRLERVWTALITGAQFLSNALPDNPAHLTYGILVVESCGVVVSACDINAWNYGFHTAAECRALAITGCTFTNVPKQIIFAEHTTDSRSYGHVRFNFAYFEWAWSPALNKIGFVN